MERRRGGGARRLIRPLRKKNNRGGSKSVGQIGEQDRSRTGNLAGEVNREAGARTLRPSRWEEGSEGLEDDDAMADPPPFLPPPRREESCRFVDTTALQLSLQLQARILSARRGKAVRG
jgi:hypothetical protein